MRYYYEAHDIVAEGEEAEFIRADITGMTDAEKEEVKKAIQDVMNGKKYVLLHHTCGHDESRGCTMEKEI